MSASYFLVIGKNEVEALSDGWYGVEKSPEGIFYRASGPLAKLTLPAFYNKAQITLLLAARPEHIGESTEVHISNGNGSSYGFTLETNHWTIRKGILDFNASSELVIEVENPWTPDNVYQNGDARSLGIMLNAMRITPLEDLQSSEESESESLWKNLRAAQK